MENDHHTTIDTKLSTLWFDDDGILYSTYKKEAPQVPSVEDIDEEMTLLREFLDGKKVCIIFQRYSKAQVPTKKHRDVILNELNVVAKAMAFVSISPVTRMMANLFFSVDPLPLYPFNMFSDEEKAREWIKQFC